MMRADTLNWHDYGGYTKTTAPSSNIFYTDEDESKRIIVHKTWSQSYSANEEKPKQSIVNENVLQNYYADVDELSSTEEDKS